MHRRGLPNALLVLPLLLVVGCDSEREAGKSDVSAIPDAASEVTTADVVVIPDAPDVPSPPDIPPDAPADVPTTDPWQPLPDVAPDVPPLPDVPAVPDAPAVDVDPLPDAAADTGPEIIWTDDCDVLGIPKVWVGDWQGMVEYDVDTGGLITNEQDTRPIAGTLQFEIGCVQSKFMVIGKMEGTLDISGTDPVPFTLGLNGFYDPVTTELSADVVDGVLDFFGLVEVYFIGDLGGTLQDDGTFLGDWTCTGTGTNNPYITGTAEGTGTWNAAEDTSQP